MDPLTHTLVGASLAATRLGQKTRLATPALVVGANLHDIDVLSYFGGEDFALGFRRGWTHGVPALVVMPAVLAALLMLSSRWRRDENSTARPSAGWLLGLSYLACLTHPFLDWLNTYGMRWWMPFRDTWSYGDSVFIMDPWLWLVLGLGWVIGRSPSRTAGLVVSVTAGLMLLFVSLAAANYLPVVAPVFLLLVLAYFWRPRAGWLSAHPVACIGLMLGSLYIGGMIATHSATLPAVRQQLAAHGIDHHEQLFAGPTPANPLVWDVVVEAGGLYRWGLFDWRSRTLQLSPAQLPAARSSPLWPQVVHSGQSKGFLHWVRFPWLEVESEGNERSVRVLDARYTRERSPGFGATVLTLPAP